MAQVTQSIWIKARDLQIVHGNDSRHWIWERLPDGEEVAKLLKDNVLDIVGKIDPNGILPKSAAYLVFKLTENRKNIDEVKAYVGPAGTPSKGHIVSLVTDAVLRPDGWYQVKLGDVPEVLHEPGQLEPGQLEAHVWGLDAEKPKSGLIVRAIQVTP